MLGIIAILRIKPGTDEEFKKVFMEMRKGVHANEPGNKLYDLFKSSDEENAYIVMEEYVDEAAAEAHRKSDHFREGGRKLGDYLAGPPEVGRHVMVE
jgi:quinol monooxygenase YgiN